MSRLPAHALRSFRALVTVPVVAGLVLVAGAAAPAQANEVADTTAPQVHSVRLQPGIVDVTKAAQQAAVTVRATDATGLRRATLTLTGPDGTTPIVRDYSLAVGDQGSVGGGVTHFTGTSTDGWWTLGVDLPQTTAAGAWNVTSLVVSDLVGGPDGAGNSRTLDAAALAALGDAAALSLQVNKVEHPEGATVSDVAFSASSLDVTDSDQAVDVTFRVQDAVDGFAHGQITLVDQQGAAQRSQYFSSWDRVAGDAYDGTYRVRFPFSRASEASSRTLHTSFSLTDNYELTKTYDVPSPTMSVVAQPDTSPPALGSVSVAPAAVTTSARQASVTYTVTAPDTAQPGEGSSGFSYASVVLTHSTGATLHQYLPGDGGTAAGADTHVMTTIVPARTTAGDWTITSVSLTDTYGNTSTYAADPDPLQGEQTLPAGPEDNRVLSVITAEETPATVQAFQLTPGTLEVGYEGTHRSLHGTITVSTATQDSTGAGVSYGQLNLTRDGAVAATAHVDLQPENRVSGDDFTGTYRISVTPHDVETYQTQPGSYTVDSIDLWGHGSEPTNVPVADTSGFTRSFTLTQLQNDSALPALTGVALPTETLRSDSETTSFTVPTQASDPNPAEAPSSGISSVVLDFTGPEGRKQSLGSWWSGSGQLVSGDDTAGVWDLTGTSGRYGGFSAGEWTLTRAEVRDHAGNTATYEGTALSAVAPSRTLTVAAPADTTGPVLTSLDLSPDALDTTAGAKSLTVTARATDASGVSHAHLVLRDASGSRWLSSSWGWNTCAEGTCTLQVDVPRYVQSGTWTVESLYLSDTWGNTTELTAAALSGRDGVQSTVQLVGAPDDAQPVVTSLSFDPAAGVDSRAGTKHVLVDATVEDQESGTSWVMFSLASPNGGTSLYAYGDRVAGDDRKAHYQFGIEVPQVVPSGNWTVEVHSQDHFGNKGLVPSAELAARSLPTTYSITALSDETAPRLTGVALDPTSVDTTQGAKQVALDLTLTDDLSGFSYGSYVFSRPDGDLRSGYGYLDESNRLADTSTYRSMLTVPQYGASGTWTLQSVTLADRTGNTRSYQAAELGQLGLGASLAVTAAVDTTPPDVTGFSFAKDTVTIGETEEIVTGTVTVTDGQSGVSFGSISLLGPTGQRAHGSFSGWSTEAGGTYDFQAWLPLNAKAGTWVVERLDVHDVSGNVRSVLGTDLPGDGLKTFTVVNTAPADGVVRGTVTVAGSDPVLAVEAAVVSLCETSGGTSCRTTRTAPDGTYSFTALENGYYEVRVSGPATGPTYGSWRGALSSSLFSYAGHTTTKDARLTEVVPLPNGTVVQDSTTNSDGVPVVVIGTPLVVSTTGCAGGTGTYVVTFSGGDQLKGSLVETSAGRYTASVGQLITTGEAKVSLAIDCPGTEPDTTTDFDIYIDPSGFVYDHDGTTTVPGAKVTLHRSETADGTFTVVPDGSDIMSPSNRRNPDLTDATGHYAWLTIAGYYRVDVEKKGCYRPGSHDPILNSVDPVIESRVVVIPPEVTDLHVTIDCRNLAPRAAFTQSRTLAIAGKQSVTFDAAGSSDANGTIASYAWDFGDGTTATGATPAPHKYAVAGDYVPTLTVTDDQGLTSTVVGKTVKVSPAPPTSVTHKPSVTVAGGTRLTTSWTVPSNVDGVQVCLVLGAKPAPAGATGCKDYAVSKTTTGARAVTPGKTYAVSLYSYKTVGTERRYSKRVSKVLYGTSLTTPAGATIKAGTSRTLSTTLKKGSTAVTGASVQLWSRPAVSGSTWKLLKTVPVDAAGTAKHAVKPTQSTVYQWRYPGSPSLRLLATTSGSTTLKIG